MTEIKNINPDHPEPEFIKKAAEILIGDGLVAFPTETVYGLGGNGLSSQAITKIFQAKNRPMDNPVILHLHSVVQAEELCYPPDDFFLLAEKFWPGPLTMVIPRKNIVPYEASGGLETVAVRMPDNQVALKLIETAQLPLAAPSANLSGRPSPTSAQHVSIDLRGKIDMILDGGTTGVGLESTVIDLSQYPYQILRPGGITWENLKSVLDVHLASNMPAETDLSNQEGEGAGKKLQSEEVHIKEDSVKSPGLKYTHYAPKGELYLVETGDSHFAADFQKYLDKFIKSGDKTGVLLTKEMMECDIDLSGVEYYRLLGSEDNLNEIAHNIYDALRDMDCHGVDKILCPTFNTQGIGYAVMNRLLKASHGRILK